MVTIFTLEIGLANFSGWIFDSFLGLLLPSIPSLKCMQSMKSKLAETNICQPNTSFRAKPYFMGGHFFNLEIGLANFSGWIFDSFLGLLLPSIPSLKCMQSMKSKLAETNICQPNTSFRAKPYFMGGHFFNLEIGLANFSG